jgi:hypothetical protein
MISKNTRYFAMTALIMLSPVLADNAIYIDQIGSNSEIGITQDGSGNTIRGAASSTTKMELNGDSMNFDANIVGDTNSLIGAIIGDSTTIDLDIDGSNNIFNFDVDKDNVYGAANGTFTTNILGSGNTFDLDVGSEDAADGVTLNWDITGDYNTFDYDIDVNSAISTITSVGDYLDLTYDADGYDGHEFELTNTGNYNTLVIDQQSTLQQDVLKIDVTGSGTSLAPSTICISQSDSGSATGCP